MTFPNVLTLSRLFLAFLLWPLLLWDSIGSKLLALLIFILASLTDLFDGLIARRRHTTSIFGAIMDPIADKVLILSALISFVGLGIVPLWAVLVISIREIAITFLRLWLMHRGVVLPAELAGKQKTVSQIITILYILTFMNVKSLSLHYFSYWPQGLELFFRQSSLFLVLTATTFTLISGFSYFRDLSQSTR